MPYMTQSRKLSYIMHFLRENPDWWSAYSLAKALGYSHPSTVRDALEELYDRGYVVTGEFERHNGMSVTYYCASEHAGDLAHETTD